MSVSLRASGLAVSGEAPLRLEVEHLPAGHAADAGGARQRGNERDADCRVGIGLLVGKHVEGKRQKRVADEDRGRVVIGAVRRRPAAAEIVVVHRRQVVVHQAVAMDQLDRSRGAQHARPFGSEKARRLDRQERPQPFAAGKRRVAHRLDQPLRPRDLACSRLCAKQPGKGLLHRASGEGQAALE